MDFLDLAKKRFSVRKFKEDNVPQDIIDKIIEAGHVAPTACNKQPQKIIVINNKEGQEKFRKCTSCHYDCPLAFIISYEKDKAWVRSFDGKNSGDVDCTIVTTHMMLEAASLGIGSTWIMYFDPAAIKKEFNFSSNLEPVAVLVMGYPAEGVKPSASHNQFKNLNETVSYNK